MLYLSVGMPRAGSGWYYNLMHDLVVAAGGKDARSIRSRYHLGWTLTEVNCNIGALSPHRLLAAWLPSALGNTYVIKAHAAPTPAARLWMRLGWLKTAYIYRDPRDALLSALEHGQRSRQNGQQNVFVALESFAHGLNFMRAYVRISEAWLNTPDVHATRYETLLSDYTREAARLAAFVGATPERAQPVTARYRPKSAAQAEQRGLHFRKGKIGRFRDVFTTEERQACREAFGDYLERMGYQP